MDQRSGATVGSTAPGSLGALATVLAAALISTACSTAAGTVAPAPEAAPPSTTTIEASGAASAEAPEAVEVVEPGPELIGAADTLPKEIAGGYPTVNSEFGQLTDVRVAPQDGFDRMVLQFDGDLVPAWQVAYVAPPVTTAESGEVVPLDGTAFLQLSVAPAGAVPLPGAAGPGYPGADRITLPDGTAIRELVKIGDWEGTLSWTAGTTGELPFAVATLQNPARLVIDVQHPQ